MPRHLNNEFTLVKEKCVLRGRVFDVRQESWRNVDGNTFIRDTIVSREAAATLPFDHQGRIMLIRQFRPAVREWLLEIPAGMLEKGESPLAGAKRELIEETGFAARKWKKLAAIYTTPGFCAENIHIFEARDLRPAIGEKDEDEQIEVVTMTITQACRAIRSGKICDAKTISALMCYAMR